MTFTRLLHTGSPVVDFVYRISDLPAPGEERVASDSAMLPGGAFNMMAAARAAGMDVACAGRVGHGPHGDLLMRHLAAHGIPLLLPRVARDSGTCVVLVCADAERSFVSYPGADGWLGAADLAGLFPRRDDVIVVSGYTLSYPDAGPALAAWIDSLPSARVVAFDPAPVVDRIPQDLRERVLARADWLSCNAAEARILTGASETSQAARALALGMRRGGVVVRDGPHGCVLALPAAEPLRLPAPPVRPVDTNGAGDTHFGAFLAALSRGDPPVEAARYANAAAALAVTREGAAVALTDDEIRSFAEGSGLSGGRTCRPPRR